MFLCFSFFASVVYLRHQVGPRMAHQSPKTVSREAQDGSKSAHERLKSGPRWLQEAMIWTKTEVQSCKNPSKNLAFPYVF